VILEWTLRFRRAYQKLSPEQQQRVNAALDRLVTDMRHPSLRVKKLQGTEIWSARASDELRLTFEPITGGIRLRIVGHHDATLRSP